jgi:hypothetical protein
LIDPVIFWTALGALAALVPVLAGIWGWIWRPYKRSKEAVTRFMADLSMRHVLYEEVGVERPDRASASLEQIRTGAAQLYGVLNKRRYKTAAEGIREASREAALAIREQRRMPGALEAVNWFADDLNAYREQVRPLVEALCEHYRIPTADRPRITLYRPGFGSPPMGAIWIPSPDQELIDRLLDELPKGPPEDKPPT